MTSKDTADTLELALSKTGFDNVKIRNRPRLLSDNGPSYVSSECSPSGLVGQFKGIV